MNMLQRMLGAAALNRNTFEDVEHDQGAMLQALAVVVLVAVAIGAGSLLQGDGNLVRGLLFGVLRGVLSWAIWAVFVWFIGTKMLGTPETQASWGQVSRCTGFAQTPGLLIFFIFLPAIGWLFEIVPRIWQFAAMLTGVRQALDYRSTWRAFFVVAIGFLPVIIINAVLFWVLQIGGPESEPPPVSQILFLWYHALG